MDTRRDVSQCVIMGDSLSDRGGMFERRLLGVLPMSWLSGLRGKSPEGSFTNGYVWSDDFGASLANDVTIRMLKEKYHLTDLDITNAIMNNDTRILSLFKNAYTLNDSTEIKYDNQELVRFYAEGGLTSKNYKGSTTWSITRLFSRQILTNLDTMREKLLASDELKKITPEQKASTLIIEWSGANDLITVNTKPTRHDVDMAIKSRIRNVELLIRAGYCNFTLFNLPDLALTPQYQAMSLSEQMKISQICMYFNDQLSRHLQSIRIKYPLVSVNIYDIHQDMNKIYNNPERYRLDPDKRRSSFVESTDFKVDKNGRSPSSGYLYWDKTGHPTADVHALLTEEYLKHFRTHYNFKFVQKSEVNKLPQKSVLRHTM